MTSVWRKKVEGGGGGEERGDTFLQAYYAVDWTAIYVIHEYDKIISSRCKFNDLKIWSV